jgi:hypothetical protein
MLRTAALFGLFLAGPAHAEEPAAAPAGESNADLNVKLTKGDGSVVEGHVVRVERSNDWYAEKDWTDNKYKLTVTLEDGDTEIEKDWKDLKSVEIATQGRSGIDCTFDSSFTPMMYTCTMRTTPTTVGVDGKKYKAVVRHKWRFTFQDGKQEVFWLYKLPERQQETSVAEMGDGSTQDFSLYQTLQDKLMERVKSAAFVQKIEISAP